MVLPDGHLLVHTNNISRTTELKDAQSKPVIHTYLISLQNVPRVPSKSLLTLRVQGPKSWGFRNHTIILMVFRPENPIFRGPWTRVSRMSSYALVSIVTRSMGNSGIIIEALRCISLFSIPGARIPGACILILNPIPQILNSKP